MKPKFIAITWAIAATAVIAFPAKAQDLVVPQLDGRFDVDPQTGVISGDVCIRAASPTRSFVLNRGLNIRSVRDRATGEVIPFGGFYDSMGSGDGTIYEVESQHGSEGLCIQYTGAFPVYRVDDGERALTDWKGQIAFDGNTVRADEQSRFYPVFRSPSGFETSQMAYDVEIACSQCSAIYWNGSPPVAGPTARFQSTLPRGLLLYAGSFPFRSQGAHFVGASVTAGSATAISAGLATIANELSGYMDLEMTDAPSLMSFAAVGRDRTLGRNTWQFATWPTIGLDGRVDFEVFAEGAANGRLAPSRERFLAHEMAHQYFGARFVPKGPLFWFLLESTAEYLSLYTVRALQGEAAFAALRDSYLRQINDDVVPLDEVTDIGQIDDAYRYRLGPLLLLALEGQVGHDVLQDTLRELVNSGGRVELDYADFRSRLERAGAEPARLTAFESACLQPRLTAECRSMIGSSHE